MIVKKIKNPKKSSSKEQRISKLVRYIRKPEHENSQEKCIYEGARGFVFNEAESQIAEMISLSEVAIRSKDTVNHYVISWHQGEIPKDSQIEEVVDIFLGELGVKEHQVIYGLHADTDNYHLHILINRVHPEAEKVMEINRGFDIEAAHRAVAKIEKVQGWQREVRSRYAVLENGELQRVVSSKRASREPDQTKRDMEIRTGEKSAERIGIEEGGLIIQAALSWQDLHIELAKKGMRYEQTGSGATLFVGDIGVKASSVHREASFAKLQKRLGPYEPNGASLVVAKREPTPMQPGQYLWREYIHSRTAHYKGKNEEWEKLKTVHDTQRTELATKHREQRDAIFNGDWHGRGGELNALRSLTAMVQAQERLILRDEQQKERDKMKKFFPPFPDFNPWREHLLHGTGPALIVGIFCEVSDPRDIRSFVGKAVGGQVHYSRGDASEEVSFIDRGRSIDLYEWQVRETTLAALQLASQKWSSFEIHGTKEYQAMCVRLAAENGFKITNLELQREIQMEMGLLRRKTETKIEPTNQPRALTR